MQSSRINSVCFIPDQLGQMQPDRRGPDAERDDAFHRWLTSTELNADNTNSMDDSLERETPASTIIDDVGTANKSDRSIGGIGGIGKDNGNDAVFFRSSYNDYSSEFNGSVVNIDITLTAVDVHPRRQTDLIANGNRTSGANDNGNSSSSQVGAAGTTMNPVAVSTSSSTRSSNNQDQPQQSPVVPPYTLTTIITTAPMAPGRMCNVLGKQASRRRWPSKGIIVAQRNKYPRAFAVKLLFGQFASICLSLYYYTFSLRQRFCQTKIVLSSPLRFDKNCISWVSLFKILFKPFQSFC